MLDVDAAPVMGTDSAPSAVEECDGHKAEFNDESIEGGAAGLEGARDEVILMVGLHAVLYPLAVHLHLERMITFTRVTMTEAYLRVVPLAVVTRLRRRKVEDR